MAAAKYEQGNRREQLQGSGCCGAACCEPGRRGNIDHVIVMLPSGTSTGPVSHHRWFFAIGHIRGHVLQWDRTGPPVAQTVDMMATITHTQTRHGGEIHP